MVVSRAYAAPFWHRAVSNCCVSSANNWWESSVNPNNATNFANVNNNGDPSNNNNASNTNYVCS